MVFVVQRAVFESLHGFGEGRFVTKTALQQLEQSLFGLLVTLAISGIPRALPFANHALLNFTAHHALGMVEYLVNGSA